MARKVTKHTTTARVTAELLENPEAYAGKPEDTIRDLLCKKVLKDGEVLSPRVLRAVFQSLNFSVGGREIAEELVQQTLRTQQQTIQTIGDNLLEARELVEELRQKQEAYSSERNALLSRILRLEGYVYQTPNPEDDPADLEEEGLSEEEQELEAATSVAADLACDAAREDRVFGRTNNR